MATRLRVLVPVTGAYHGRLRVRRSTGELDTEGLDRILSDPSVRALTLARSLPDAEVTAVHVDKGAGDDILREALAYGVEQGILIEGSEASGADAAVRAATIGDVVAQHGPFDVIMGPARSEFSGFSGTLAAVAGHLGLPCVVGVTGITPVDEASSADAATGSSGSAAARSGFMIDYHSIFGRYRLRIPCPCVVLVGDIPRAYPTSWAIEDAFGSRGILRVQADQFTVERPRSRRRRIEAVRPPAEALEEVDAPTLVRRLRSRGFVPEAAHE